MGLTFFLTPHLAYARGASQIGVSIEPIIAYDWTYRSNPAPRKTQELAYGGRLAVGFYLFSLEGEYTRSELTETVSGISVYDETHKVKVGIRSTIRMGKTARFAFRLRAGAQGKRIIHREAGVTTTEADVIRPYGGAGLQFRMLRNMSANLDATAIFNEFPNMSTTEYQTSFSLGIRFP